MANDTGSPTSSATAGYITFGPATSESPWLPLAALVLVVIIALFALKQK